MSLHKKKYKLTKRLKNLSSSTNDYTDLWDQWILIDSMHIDDIAEDFEKITNWNTHSYNKNHHNSCLCSKHPIKNINFMKNCYTNERCVIGCCCIKKFGSKELKCDLKVKRGQKEGKRYCEICKRKLPSNSEPWEIYHKKCYNKN